MGNKLYPSWTQGLSQYRNYYEGTVEEDKLDKTLELHKRDAATIFGIRSSHEVKKSKPLCS